MIWLSDSPTKPDKCFLLGVAEPPVKNVGSCRLADLSDWQSQQQPQDPSAVCSGILARNRNNKSNSVVGIQVWKKKQKTQPHSCLIIWSFSLLGSLPYDGDRLHNETRFHPGCDQSAVFPLELIRMLFRAGGRVFHLRVSSLQQERPSAPFAHQSVRRAHGLRSAARSTLFTQPPSALPPQVSGVSARQCVCVFALTQRCLQQIKMNLDEWPKWTVPQLVQQLWKSAVKVSYVAVISCQSELLLTHRQKGLKSAIRPDKLPGIHQKVAFFCLFSQFSDHFRGSSL